MTSITPNDCIDNTYGVFYYRTDTEPYKHFVLVGISFDRLSDDAKKGYFEKFGSNVVFTRWSLLK